MLNGYVIYKGASILDGSPIIAVATGFAASNANSKLGSGLIQSWILRADISPVEAVLSDADHSVCGACSLRGTVEARRVTNRTCYVPVFLAPLSVWNTYVKSETNEALSELPSRAKRTGYGNVSGKAEISDLFADRGIRLGSYGDPTAVPPAIWEAVTARANFWTGYTHHWRTCDPMFARWCMASCETDTDRSQAHALGYRTFRTTMLDARLSRSAREVVCPASAEGGRKSTCERCRICGGNDSAGRNTDVVITMHGIVAKRLRKLQSETAQHHPSL